LSEDFIAEFRDMVDWWYIKSRQKYSQEFVQHFKTELERAR